MGTYADLNGVKTWYDERGEGEPLVLLHPGLVDSRVFEPNIDAFASRFRTLTPERRGHGRTPDVGTITFELMAEDTVGFLEHIVGGPARLLGCSDGAIVALVVALRRPDLVSRLVFIAEVFRYEGWLPGVIDPKGEPPEFLASNYGEVSPDGIEHFPVVAEKLARMHLLEPALTTADLSRIKARTLVMQGDDDEVRLEHAIDLYRALPNAELAVMEARRVPGCRDFVAAADPIEPDRVNVYEEWDTDANLEQFRGTGPAPELAGLIKRTEVSRHQVASSGPA